MHPILYVAVGILIGVLASLVIQGLLIWLAVKDLDDQGEERR